MRRFSLILLTTMAGLYLAALAASTALEPNALGPAVAPDPAQHPDAVIQVYGADVWGVRGHFAIHTWVATKAAGERNYTTHQVIGWRLRRDGSALSVTQGKPNKPWFRSPAVLLHEVRGPGTQTLVARVRDAASTYPYAKEYVMWPGPNSNSFVQWIALQVPELGLELPAKAIGKNWMLGNYSPP